MTTSPNPNSVQISAFAAPHHVFAQQDAACATTRSKLSCVELLIYGYLSAEYAYVRTLYIYICTLRCTCPNAHLCVCLSGSPAAPMRLFATATYGFVGCMLEPLCFRGAHVQTHVLLTCTYTITICRYSLIYGRRCAFDMSHHATRSQEGQGMLGYA